MEQLPSENGITQIEIIKNQKNGFKPKRSVAICSKNYIDRNKDVYDTLHQNGLKEVSFANSQFKLG